MSDDTDAIVKAERDYLIAECERLTAERDALADVNAENVRWKERAEAERDAARERCDAFRKASILAADVIAHWRVRAEAAEAAVERVRALHRQCGDCSVDWLPFPHNHCTECEWGPWPCPTAAALSGEPTWVYTMVRKEALDAALARAEAAEAERDSLHATWKATETQLAEVTAERDGAEFIKNMAEAGYVKEQTRRVEAEARAEAAEARIARVEMTLLKIEEAIARGRASGMSRGLFNAGEESVVDLIRAALSGEPT